MQLYNSITKRKEKFIPIHDKNVSIYVCGITPYDTTHIGHAFTYISFDVLVRYLTYKAYNVSYTQNVTDINDRDNDILKFAQEKNIPWTELSVYWTKRFLDDMKKLGWVFPTNYLLASEQIPSMIALIQKLINNSYAYQVNESVYLDITHFPQFGMLSGLSEEEMLSVAGEFEEDITNLQKRHPLDITLWRSSALNQAVHIPSFASPFGKGRPGWHIECSAMAVSTLGEQIDIHGGGKDLMYPHHESEIIQSEGATGKIPFAKYWMHTGTVFYQGKKMSKSLANLVMVSELLKKYSANAIRFALLSHHYKESWEFTHSEVKEAEKTVSKLLAKTKGLGIHKEILLAFDDDLNTPQALKRLMGEKTISQDSLSLLGFSHNF